MQVRSDSMEKVISLVYDETERRPGSKEMQQTFGCHASARSGASLSAATPCTHDPSRRGYRTLSTPRRSGHSTAPLEL